MKSRDEVYQGCTANEIGEYKYKCDCCDDDPLFTFAVGAKVLRHNDGDHEVDDCRKTACPKRIQDFADQNGGFI